MRAAERSLNTAERNRQAFLSATDDGDVTAASPALISTVHAATILGLTDERVRRMLEAGTLEGYRDGARWRVYRADVERLASWGKSTPLDDALAALPDILERLSRLERLLSALLSTEMGRGQALQEMLGLDKEGRPTR